MRSRALTLPGTIAYSHLMTTATRTATRETETMTKVNVTIIRPDGTAIQFQANGRDAKSVNVRDLCIDAADENNLERTTPVFVGRPGVSLKRYDLEDITR